MDWIDIRFINIKCSLVFVHLTLFYKVSKLIQNEFHLLNLPIIAIRIMVLTLFYCFVNIHILSMNVSFSDKKLHVLFMINETNTVI